MTKVGNDPLCITAVRKKGARTKRQKEKKKDSKKRGKKGKTKKRDRRKNTQNKLENREKQERKRRRGGKKRACRGGGPRPHGLLQVGGVHRLPPHAHLPPQEQLLLLGVLHPLQDVVRVEDLPGGRQMVQVPRVEVAHQHAVAPGGREGRGSLVDPAGGG